MKIDPKLTKEIAATRGIQRAAPVKGGASERSRAGAAGGVTTPRDVTSVMGIPEAEFTPKVREAIMALMAEVDALRRELQMAQSRLKNLEQLADQDTLAPIANRRAFVRELSRMLSYAERYSTPSAVIYFDVNGLKQINDTFGHSAGDAALTRIAELLSRNIRESDVVGRLGGDEFGVILSHADETAAVDKAAFLAKVIEETPFDWQGKAITLSVSWGSHAFTTGGDPAHALDAADREMYARKRSTPRS